MTPNEVRRLENLPLPDGDTRANGESSSGKRTEQDNAQDNA